MGHGLMFYIDEDNWEHLSREENRSRVINNLLREYFKSKETESFSIEEREKNLKIKKLELETLKKIEEIENEHI